MEKIKVKDIISMFEDGNYTSIYKIVITAKDGTEPLMICAFRSWVNITPHILENNVNKCSVGIFDGDVTLKIYVEE